MKLVMVIINYNDYKTTMNLIDNIKDYKCLNDIIVVDNNSTDNSYKYLKKISHNNIDIIRNTKSRNFSSGLNLGAKYVIKKFGKCNIIFSNSDIIIKSEEDLIKLSSDIKDDIGIVGPIIEQCGEFNRGWHLSNVWTEILYNIAFIHKYFKKKYLYYNDSHYKGDLSYVDVVSGCFFLISSNVLEEINYFDENTFLYYEENILAKRVKMTNYKTVIDNRISIIHNHSVSVDKSFKKVGKYKILKESQKYYVKEYLGASKFQLMLLYITNKFSLIILYIRCFFKRS